MTTSITTRAGKGSALTHNEVDANFNNLKMTADAALPSASVAAAVQTWLATPSSANLAAALTDEAGSGKVVFTAGTLDVASGKTLTVSNTLTLTGTDGTSFAFPSASDTVACLATAQTFTKTQTITPAANTQGLVVSGYSLTGSNAQSLVDLAGTWNTSGNPVAIKVSMTNTASGSTTKFVSCLAGASGTTEVFHVKKDGATGGLKFFSVAGNMGFDPNESAGAGIWSGGSERMRVNNSAVLCGTFPLGFGAAVTGNDVAIGRAAASILDLNNGTIGGGGALRLNEMSAPSAPAADKVVIYAVDNGAGKTQLMALFSSGAAQQLAIQP